MNQTTTPAVTVKYWRGTTLFAAIANSYEEAMEIAGRNENAYEPRFYDAAGVRLYDMGGCLCYEPQPGENTVCAYV